MTPGSTQLSSLYRRRPPPAGLGPLHHLVSRHNQPLSRPRLLRKAGEACARASTHDHTATGAGRNMSADSSGDSPRRSPNGSRSPRARGCSPRSSRAGSSSPLRPPASFSPGREYATEPPSDTPARVFVYGLTAKVVERHIDEIFGFYGSIERLRMTPPHCV